MTRVKGKSFVRAMIFSDELASASVDSLQRSSSLMIASSALKPCMSASAPLPTMRATLPLNVFQSVVHADRDTLARLPDDAAEVPHGAPEIVRSFDRKPVELLVVFERRAPLRRHVPHEVGEPGASDALG
jgi:hypothetical protein